MKKLFLFLSAGLIFGVIFFASCGGGNGEPDLTPQQEQAMALQGTWTIQNATVPQGVDPAIINGVTLTFSIDQNHNPTSFASVGNADFFSTSASSEWAFSGTSTTLIVLSGVTPVTGITVNNVSGNSLSISFSHPGLAGARIADLSGAYTAQLTK